MYEGKQNKASTNLIRWAPALAMMVLIFTFSSIPAREIPTFPGWLELLVKKGGHVTGYALLAMAYRRGLGSTRANAGLWGWVLAVLYALSDEYHQSFVPGRGATLVDVGIDALGAGLGLWLGFLRSAH